MSSSNAGIASTEHIIPFTYVVKVSCSALAIGTGTISIDNSSDFVVAAFTAFHDKTDTAKIYPNDFEINIQDQGTSRNFMNLPVPQAVFCGNAFQGYVERANIRFIRNTTLMVNVTNLVNQASVVTLALHGYKVFGPI